MTATIWKSKNHTAGWQLTENDSFGTSHNPYVTPSGTPLSGFSSYPDAAKYAAELGLQIVNSERAETEWAAEVARVAAIKAGLERAAHDNH
mgnify:CR=1 FL=1